MNNESGIMDLETIIQNSQFMIQDFCIIHCKANFTSCQYFVCHCEHSEAIFPDGLPRRFSSQWRQQKRRTALHPPFRLPSSDFRKQWQPGRGDRAATYNLL